MRDPKTRPKPFAIQDFKLDYWKQRAQQSAQQSVEQMRQTMLDLARALEQSKGK